MRFHCYSLGDLHASVCTDLVDEVAAATLDLEEPDAIGPWRVSEEPFGAETDHPVPNGTACPDGLVGCRHVLFVRGPAK